jgi:hypothetical protein
MKKIKLSKNEILVLHTNDENNQAYGGFQYPKSGEVFAPDWDGLPECGGGLHGLARGCGDGSLINWGSDGFALLLKVNSERIIDLQGKCKFERGEIVFCKKGGLSEAINLMKAVYPDAPIVGVFATAGDRGTATAGYGGTATAGYGGTLIIKRWDCAATRWRREIAYVGENGIEPGKKYKLDDDNKFVTE